MTWGRGSYRDGGSAVEQVLAQIAEQSRRDEEAQRQEAMQRAEMEQRAQLAQQGVEAQLYAELMRNASDPRAYEIAKSRGLAVPDHQFLPPEQAKNVAAQHAIGYYGNPEGMSPGFGAMSAYQVGTGAAIPREGAMSAINQDLYTRPNMPSQMVEGADIGLGRKMSAEQIAADILDQKRTAAQNAASYASAESSRANAATEAARARLLGEQTTNERSKRDPNSPLAPKPAGQTKPTKPSSAIEKRAMNFYLRAKDAVDQLEKDYEGKPLHETVGNKGVVGQTWLKVAPNVVQPEENQLYIQAQRQFTEARLRKDSGAAIPEHEFENDRRTYFAQPGDSRDVIARKKAARENILNALKFEAGRAFSEYHGTDDGGGGAGGSALQKVADKFFGGDIAKAEEYLRNKGAIQ